MRSTASLASSLISPECVGDTITATMIGDYFNVGIHQVVYYLRNGAGIKDSCKFNVNREWQWAHRWLCAEMLTSISGTDGTVKLNISDIDNGSSDNCSLLLVPNRSDFTCADAGITVPVLITGTDPAGNSSTCTSQVTVLDTIRPSSILKHSLLFLVRQEAALCFHRTLIMVHLIIVPRSYFLYFRIHSPVPIRAREQ